MTPLLWVMLSVLFYGIGEALSKEWANTKYWWLIILVILSYAICDVPWLLALREKNHLTSLGMIWISGATVATVLLGTVFFKETITMQQWCGIFLALVACWMLN